MASDRASRRELLQLGGMFGAASILSGCALSGSRQPDVVAQAQGDKVTVSQAQSARLLSSEGSLLVEPKGFDDKIIVTHARDGSLHAVSAICTHRGCTVLYDPKLGHLRCPCHGSQYDLDGHNLKGPAQRPLRQYGVGNVGGLVVIALPPQDAGRPHQSL